MIEEDKQTIETILNNNDINSIEILKAIARRNGADVSHGCFCKEFNKLQLLNRIKDWYNQQTNDKE